MDTKPYSEHWPSKRRLFEGADSTPSVGAQWASVAMRMMAAMATAGEALVSFGGAMGEHITVDIPVHSDFVRLPSPRRDARRAHRRTLKRGRR